MKKRTLLMVLALGLSLMLAVGGTLAYLTDTDDAVNVMTLGNVSIEQHEKDGIGNPFEDGQALYPAYYEENTINWDTATGAITKAVTVENTGTSDAYVRTWFAFEAGDLSSYDDFQTYILLNRNEGEESWTWEWDKTQTYAIKSQYGEENYYIAVATLNKALIVGETTEESLIQLAMSKEAGNDVVSAMGDYYTVLVFTQAMQTQNFNGEDMTPAKALAIGFGDEKVENDAIGKNHPWNSENNADIDFVQDYPADTWDGTADTSWYNDADTEFVITTAEQLAGFAKLVNEGNTFEGKTVKLGKDIDLYAVDEDGERVSFDPIGDKSAFKGTFNGQTHTIENLYQSGWAFGYDWYNYGSLGLFGEIESATIQNLTISGAESLVEGGDVGGITGSATGTCVFENITIEDSVFATYNNGNGGIIGWSGAGNYTFKNVKIAEDVVLAGLWGSFDSSIGGIVGQGEPGATYNFKDVDIACRLDVYNDCTASYDYYNYRMCGMIIGRLAKTTTIDGANYPDMSQYNITCNNVTVTYGDWANYHYCEPTPGYNNGRGMRVETGYSYDGLPADYDHSQCTTNHNTLIPFDQIFGGDQLGVKGLKTYDGVNVIYNNK